MQLRYEKIQNSESIQAKESSGTVVSEELKKSLLQGAEEVDLVRSGLGDTMRMAFQSIRERYWSRGNVSS